MNHRFSRLLPLLLALLSIALMPPAGAAEIAGVKLPDQTALEGKTLHLNGVGLRQATILKVNVYAAGLYLEKPSSDAAAILNSEQTKSIEMTFLRDVSAKQMTEALEESFTKNCTNDCAKLKPELARVQALMKDMKRGQTMAYHFFPEKVELMLGGQTAGTIEGKPFSREFLRCWLGQNPPNAGLKDGLLGGKKS